MIKEVSYSYHEHEVPGKLTRETTLIAELRFEGETFQRGFLGDKDRFDLSLESELSVYLAHSEGLHPTSPPEYGYRFKDPRRTLTLSNPPFTKQALDLRVVAEGEQIPREQMFDLDALNNFILSRTIKST